MNGIGSKRRNVGGNVVLKSVIVTVLLLIVKVTMKTENLKLVKKPVKLKLRTRMLLQPFKSKHLQQLQLPLLI